MKNSIHKIKDYVILTENYKLEKDIKKEVKLIDEMIGFVFYASGKMSVDVSINNKKKKKENLKQAGIASSFYYSPNDTIVNHNISSEKSISKLSLFVNPKALKRLIGDENESNDQLFKKLLNPDAPFIEGSNTFMNYHMYTAVQKIMHCEFSGLSKNLLLESQATELVAQYFNKINNLQISASKVLPDDADKLYFAKEIILSKLDSPPSLAELSKLCGLNNFKLKNGFKQLFGIPVYQYILHKRMELAFEAIQEKGKTVQEAAWLVGYTSLGSFSNAFYKKFGIRPSTLIK